MNKQLQLYLSKFNTLSLRERIMVYAAASLIVVFLGDFLFISPLARQKSLYDAQVMEQVSETQRIRQQLDALRSAASLDPDAAAKARIQQIQAQIGQIDTSLRSVQKQLVPPERMAGLLEEILKRNRRVQLIRLRTLPLAGLIEAEAKAPAEQISAEGVKAEGKRQDGATLNEINVFKHGVEITVQGSYPELLDYLTQIERLPWQMFWGKVALTVEEYPRARLVLVLYTLSLDKAWLTI